MIEIHQPGTARHGVQSRANQTSGMTIVTVWLLAGILLCTAIDAGLSVLNEIRVRRVMSGLRDFGEKMKESK